MSPGARKSPVPSILVTAEAAQLGAADTTPDNLYMIGTFRLAPDEALVLDLEPPDTRYWSVTLENIWHECIDPRRRTSSATFPRSLKVGTITDSSAVLIGSLPLKQLSLFPFGHADVPFWPPRPLYNPWQRLRSMSGWGRFLFAHRIRI